MRTSLLIFTGVLGAGVYLQAQEGPNPPPEAPPQAKQRLHRIVQQAPAGQPGATAFDPLEYYRKNPELMRRYFPHLAQKPGQPGTPSMSNMPAPGSLPRESAEIIPKISFPGGTTSDLVELLKKTVQPAPNIMIAPGAADDQILPAFELQNVTLSDVFQALNHMDQKNANVWELTGSAEPIWVLRRTGAQDSYGAPGGRPYLALDPTTGHPLPSGPQKNLCQVLAVGRFLPKYKIEDITTAVKTAWDMMGVEAGAQMKYHKDTELLIAVGSAEQLGVLRDVLVSLEQGLLHRAPESKKPQSPPQTF